MLNAIKNIIKEKKAFQESANIILENEALDDSIILGQEAKEEEPAVAPEEKPEEKPAEEEITTAEEIEATPEEVPAEPAAEPTTTDDASSILATEIDLATNTSTDTIPIAPNTADDVVVDDIMNTEIDAEPAEPVPVAQPVEEPVEDDILNTEIDTDDTTPAPAEEPKEEENILDSEIDDDAKEESAHVNMSTTSDMDGKVTFDKTKAAIADDSKETQKESDKEVNEIAAKVKALPATERAALMKELGIPYTEAISIDDSANEGGEEDATEEEPKEKNDVTAAIEDKVGELNADEPAIDDTASETSGGVVNGNEALMKKLSNLTKTIEDIKMNVMSGKNE